MGDPLRPPRRWERTTPAAAADSSPAAAAGTDATNGAVSQSYGANVTILGHGFGHGEGMGQWGAYGYATTYGWSWQQILGHYYGGTTLGSTDPNQYVSVRLQALDDRPFTAFVQDSGLLFTSADGLIGRYRRPGRRRDRHPGRRTQVWGRSDATLCPNMAAPFGSARLDVGLPGLHLLGGQRQVPRRRPRPAGSTTPGRRLTCYRPRVTGAVPARRLGRSGLPGPCCAP